MSYSYVAETVIENGVAHIVIKCPVENMIPLVEFVAKLNGAPKNEGILTEKIVKIQKKIVPSFEKKEEPTKYPTQKCHVCHDAGISKFASYCMPGSNRPTACGKHKREDMKTVNSRVCRHPDCEKNASYNFADKKGVRFCNAHKEEGMIIRSGIREPTVIRNPKDF
jgi:hypothetical protein